MPVDPRTPVLVGVGVAWQREEDPARGVEPLLLMERALERAAEDAGSRALLAAADSVRAPQGFWAYPDPCRWLAERFGAAGARTEIARVGVLQTTLLGRAARDVAEGRADVVLLTGGEARHRFATRRAAGLEDEHSVLPERPPDSVLEPHADIIHPLEIRTGLGMPVGQYALIENALRAAEGQALEKHRREVAALWARLSAVAAANPDAWSREALSAEEIGEPGPGNRMLAFPYTVRLASQWTVDQAAGLVLCSLEKARALGLPEERWVYPLAVVDSEHMLPLSQRDELHRSPGFALAGERALADAGCEIDDVAHLELYSCFPAAVRLQQRELAVPAERPPSVTGGMTFAGGPLNNFVLQAWARMVQVLRASPGTGLVTAISGMVTKQGVSVLATEPRAAFQHGDVTADVASRVRAHPLAERTEGAARVLSLTVFYEGGAPARGVLLCERDDGLRCIATVADPDLAADMTREEFCGRSVRLGADGAVAFG